MKRLMLAMMALVVLLASCSKEEAPGQINGEESLVTFNLSTDQLATKAVGDGTTAQKLYYAVYQDNTTIIENISKMDGSVGINLSANVSIPLLNGEKYSIVFFAAKEDVVSSGTTTPTKVCHLDWEKKTMTYNPSLANQESYDVFYAFVPEFTVTGNKQETIKLTRPFAQLNIGTKAGDLAELTKYYGNVDNSADKFVLSKVLVKSLKNTLSLENGTLSGTEADVTYDFSDINVLCDNHYSTVANAKEEFPVAGYEYLAMNYVLASAEKQLVNIEFTIDRAAKNQPIVKGFENIPVQRNYQTNIYGDLYASTFEYKVDITPDFAGQYQTLSGVWTLTEDTELKETLVVMDKAVIDLNGYTFKYSGSNDIMARVWDGGELTFYGDKPGSSLQSTGYIASANVGGTINVVSGEYTTLDDVTCFQTNGGNLNIKGGVFEAKLQYGNKYWTINRVSNSGEISITGGTFINFDPSANQVDNPTANFVASGYKSLEVAQGIFVIVEESSTTDNIKMASDMTMNVSLNVKDLDGGNNTLFTSAQKSVVNKGGSIKNLAIDAKGQKAVTASGAQVSVRAMWFENTTGDILIENVKVQGTGYAFNTGSNIKEGSILTVKNSSFENWMSHNGFASASYEGCQFNVGNYFEAGSEFNGGFRPYINTVFTNCEFEQGFKIDAYYVLNEGSSNEKVYAPTLKFVNCKINGVLLTSSNISGLLFTDDSGKPYNVEVQ